MIVWGGSDGTNLLNTGGRYDSGADSWAATSITNAPTARYRHTAVGTGSEMIVWGGTDDLSPFNTGGRYDPGADTWTATSTTGAPNARFSHTAVWIGGEMIVWGGVDVNGNRSNNGGRYCAQSGPTPIPPNAFSYSNTYAVHGKMHTNAEAASKSSAQALGTG